MSEISCPDLAVEWILTTLKSPLRGCSLLPIRTLIKKSLLVSGDEVFEHHPSESSVVLITESQSVDIRSFDIRLEKPLSQGSDLRKITEHQDSGRRLT